MPLKLETTKRRDGRNFSGSVYKLEHEFDAWASMREVEKLKQEKRDLGFLVRVVKDEYKNTIIYIRPKSAPKCKTCGGNTDIIAYVVGRHMAHFTYHCKACNESTDWSDFERGDNA